MQLEVANFVANAFRNAVSKHCEELEVAGSLRRNSTNDQMSFGDVDFVCVTNDLVGLLSSASAAGFRAGLNMHYAEATMIPFITPFGAKVDVMFAEKRNFGSAMVIWTGPRSYNKMLETRLGKSYDEIAELPSLTEKAFFERYAIRYTESNVRA